MKFAYQQMNLLLVDSMGIIMDTVADYLKPFGFYRVFNAKSGEEAMALLADQRVDLIISNWKLKAMSGPQLCEAARKVKSDLPVILLVDRKDKMFEQKAKEVQVTALLVMPLDSKVLTAAVQEALAPFIDEDEEQYSQCMQNARQAMRKSDLTAAIDNYRQALSVKPDDEDAREGLAKALYEKGDLAEAEQAFIGALRANPLALRCYLGLGETYQSLNRLEDALKVLNGAAVAARRLKQGGVTESGILFQIGEIELMLERLQSATEHFNQAVSALPEDDQLKVKVGDTLVSSGHPEESEQFYKAALAHNPNLLHVYNRLGIAYRRQGKYDAALDLYEKALILAPNDDHLLYNLARLHWETDSTEAARIALEKAISIDPEFNEARQLLAAINQGLKPRKTETGNSAAGQAHAPEIAPQPEASGSGAGSVLAQSEN